MMSLVRLGLFALSSAGWCLLLARRWGIAPELCPFVAFSGMGAVQFAAGLLNIYAPAEAVLWLGGLGLLGFYAVRRRAAFAAFKSLRSLVFCLSAGWMLFLMRGGVIAGHDNMSHWAVMAKTMLRFGRLPNAQNTAIEFTAYPPGSAGWIKYFCDAVGVSDGMMVYAQGLLLLAGAFALLVFVPKRSAAGAALGTMAVLLLLVGNIPPVDLRVDTLLAVQAAGALAVIAYYGPAQPQKAALAALPALVLEAVIKNSGLFFAAANLLVLAWFVLRPGRAAGEGAADAAPAGWKAGADALALAPGASAAPGVSGRRRALPAFWTAAAAPFAAFWLWTRHVAMIFPQTAMEAGGGASKHAVSLAGYAGMLGGKTAGELRSFFGLFARHFFDLSQADTRVFWVLAVGSAALLAGLYAAGRLPGRRAAGLWAALAGCELAYILCLFGTYVFSMNTAEMLCLASITRYHLTALLYLAAALAIILLRALTPAGMPRPQGGTAPAEAASVRGGAAPAKKAAPALSGAAPVSAGQSQGGPAPRGGGRKAVKPGAFAAAGAVLLAAMLLLGTPSQLKALWRRAPYRDTETQGEWLAIKSQYALEDGKRCLVYTRGGDPEQIDTWGMRYVARYVLNTDTVDFWQFDDEEYTLSELYGKYDYLIFYAPDARSEALLAENGLDPASRFVELIQ